MNEQSSLGTLLDDGGSDLARLAGVILAATALALLLAVAVPVGLLHPLLAPLQGGERPVSLTAPPSASAPVAPMAAPSLPSPSHASALDVARRYLGVPYVFGGTNPAIGLDCSGLVQLVYRQIGLTLPRTAQQQYNATARIADGQLQPGDLVFFARTYADPHDWVTHVGIYVGGGQQINAPTTGQVVSIQPVFSGFWGAHYIGGGRVGGVPPHALFSPGGLL